MSRNEDEEIARELARGAAHAVDTVRLRVRRIVSFRGYGIPPEERRDLEQEVMTQVWQAVNRPSFDPGGGFWGFVEVVTARRCIDWLRTRRRETGFDLEPTEPADSPLGSALGRERVQLAYAALAQLGKPCRDLIYLHFGLKRPYRELQDLLGKSEGALRVQMHRCLREARRILGELAEGKSEQASTKSRWGTK